MIVLQMVKTRSLQNNDISQAANSQNYSINRHSNCQTKRTFGRIALRCLFCRPLCCPVFLPHYCHGQKCCNQPRVHTSYSPIDYAIYIFVCIALVHCPSSSAMPLPDNSMYISTGCLWCLAVVWLRLPINWSQNMQRTQQVEDNDMTSRVLLMYLHQSQPISGMYHASSQFESWIHFKIYRNEYIIHLNVNTFIHSEHDSKTQITASGVTRSTQFLYNKNNNNYIDPGHICSLSCQPSIHPSIK